MTDKEIKRALEWYVSKFKNTGYVYLDVDGTKFVSTQEVLDLITRQQAEIESLKVENQSLRTAGNSLKMHYEEEQAEIENYKYLDVILHTAIDVTANIKSEAVKEFAERLKERIYNGGVHPTVEDEFMCDIDNLLKEMVGENND